MKCPNQLCQSPVDDGRTACPRCGMPVAGAVLGDRFRLEKLQRQLPVALWYTAWDTVRLEAVQVRIFVPQVGRSFRNLKAEVKALKELAFDRMPRILEFDWDADFPWVAESSLSGRTLADRIVHGDRRIQEAEGLEIIRGIASTLEKVHALSVVHRDIRPESVALTADGRTVLTAPAWERELQERARAGSRSVFTAPETAPGHVSAQADLYSLGVLAIHLFSGLNPEGLYRPDIRRFVWAGAAKVSPRLVEIVDGLVADSPKDRIQSASKLLQLLSSLDSRTPPAPVPDATAEPAPAEAARGPQPVSEAPAQDPVDNRRKAGLGIALASIAAAILAFLRRMVAELPGTWTLNGLRILVALGVLAGGLASRWMWLRHDASDSLPPPVVGQNDNPLPPDPQGLWRTPGPVRPLVRVLPWTRIVSPGPAGLPASLSAPAEPEWPSAALGPRHASGGGANLAGALPGSLAGSAARGPAGGHGGSLQAAPGAPGAGAGSTGSTGAAPGSGSGRSPAASSGNPPAGAGRQSGRPASAAAPPGSGRRQVAATPYDAAREPPVEPRGESKASPHSPYFIRINTTYHTLTLYRDGQYYAQFPITTGKGASTPEGRFVITKKVKEPSYGRIPGGSPRNPIGSRWLGLDVAYPGGKHIGIHGTNRPDQLGMSASGGCIRLRDKDVDRLYHLVPSGTPVEIL